MRRSVVGLAAVALVGMGAYSVLAGNQCAQSGGASANAGGTCIPPKSAAVSCENPHGKITGRFDPAMSGVCRFGCATKLTYTAKNVLAQPGAKTGKLTQCPVSGVVFAVDANRPKVRVAGNDYVTCCDKCATKLKKDPRHYLKA